jgi:hypothetical protein
MKVAPVLLPNTAFPNTAVPNLAPVDLVAPAP